MKRILKELELSHIAAVDRPCQEGALAVIMKRDFSTGQEKPAETNSLAKSDLSQRITQQLLGDDESFDSFEKAFDDVLECMADTSAADEMLEKFRDHKGAIAEVVADDRLTDLGKRDELTKGMNAFFTGFADEAVEQLEKSMDAGVRLRLLKARVHKLTNRVVRKLERAA